MPSRRRARFLRRPGATSRRTGVPVAATDLRPSAEDGPAGRRAVIAVVQRVRRADVRTESPPRSAGIGRGLCVLLGVEVGDGDAEADWIARKLSRLRVFADDAGRMNRDLAAIDGGVLLVSQFTLAGDCSRGNRPSFVRAAAPDEGRRLYERVRDRLAADGVPVATGVFGASMQVELVNDGPVTLIVERRPGDG